MFLAVTLWKEMKATSVVLEVQISEREAREIMYDAASGV